MKHRIDKKRIDGALKTLKAAKEYDVPDAAFEKARAAVRAEYRRMYESPAEARIDDIDDISVRKRRGVTGIAKKIYAGLQWLSRPAVLTTVSLLVSLLIYGLTVLNNGSTTVFNFTFALFQPNDIF